MKAKFVRDYFNPPIFNWFHQWKPIHINTRDLFMDNSERPVKRQTEILWKSTKTGRVKKKVYNYQVEYNATQA